jgi:DNA polymerase-3 subunit alpha
MASVLTHNLSNIDKVTFFMEECRRMGVPVLGPDINESIYNFSVNDKGQIRFGLGAIKGVGEAAVNFIVEERKLNGSFQSVFDLVRRINLRSANKKTFENLAYGGAFDSFEEMHRAHYFFTDTDSNIFLEKIIRYGSSYQESKNSVQQSLFGEGTGVEIPEPNIPHVAPWESLVRLKFEKEAIGFYVSGHPLDMYRLEMKELIKHTISNLKDLKNKGKEMAVGAMVTQVNHRISKNGKPFGNFIIEDYDDSYEMVLFGEDYLKFKMWLNPGEFLYIRGKLQDRYNQPGNTEFKISQIQLLSELRDKLLRNLTLKISIDKIDSAWIQKLDETLLSDGRMQNGKCVLKLKIYDPVDEKMSVDLPSKKYRINPDNDLLNSLKKLAEIEF